MPTRPFTPILNSPRDEPLVCLEINTAWLPFLLDVSRPFQYPEQWTGTLTENRAARLYTRVLLDIFAEAIGCDDVTNCCEIMVQTTVVLHQVNPITLALDVSIDGGQTWTPDPQSIANQTTTAIPGVTSGNSATKCDAASNGKQHLEDWIAGVSTAFDTYGSFFEWGAQVVLIILGLILWYLSAGALTGPEIAAIEAMTAALRQVFSSGKAAWDDYWTSDETDKLLCALYCTMGADGSFNDSQQQLFIKRLEHDLTGGAQSWLMRSMIGQIGASGLTNLCAYGNSADADCSSCDCPSCDLSAWTIYNGDGVIVSQSETEIIITAHDAGSFWGAGVMSNSDFACCCDIEAELTINGVLSARPPNSEGSVHCGDNRNQDAYDFARVSGQPENHFEVAFPKVDGDVLVTIRIFTERSCE